MWPPQTLPWGSVSYGVFPGISNRRDATKAFIEVRISNKGAFLKY